MITVILQGGLGNQMFQYAAAKSLSLHHNTSLQLDISNYLSDSQKKYNTNRSFELHHFCGIQDQVVQKKMPQKYYHKLSTRLSKIVTPYYKRSLYKEPFFHFDENFFKSNNNLTLIGDWQSYRYFEKYNRDIQSCFELKKELVHKTDSFINRIKDQNTVSVHIRRGDYLSNELVLNWHGVLPREYYVDSIKLLSSIENLDKILYFSDDPEWVKKEILPVIGGEIVSGRSSITSYEDFNIMQNCKHNIIGNSSFSWWAAFLNKNPTKKIIAPKNWFKNNPADTKDLIPENWIRI